MMRIYHKLFLISLVGFFFSLYFAAQSSRELADALVNGSIVDILNAGYRVPLLINIAEQLPRSVLTYISYPQTSWVLKFYKMVGYRPTKGDIVRTAYQLLCRLYQRRYAPLAMFTISGVILKQIQIAEIQAREPATKELITTQSMYKGLKNIEQGVYIITIDEEMQQDIINELNVTNRPRQQTSKALSMLEVEEPQASFEVQAAKLAILEHIIKNKIRITNKADLKLIERHIPLDHTTSLFVITFAHEALVTHVGDVWFYYFDQPELYAVGNLSSFANGTSNKEQVTNLLSLQTLLDLDNKQLVTILSIAANKPQNSIDLKKFIK